MTRRSWLLAAIRREPQPVTISRAEQLLTASPWPTAGRNTCRKDLRDLARCGHLRRTDVDGRRLYSPIIKDGAR